MELTSRQVRCWGGVVVAVALGVALTIGVPTGTAGNKDRAAAAKKCRKSKKAGVSARKRCARWRATGEMAVEPVAAPVEPASITQTPIPLAALEVTSRVANRAVVYCHQEFAGRCQNANSYIHGDFADDPVCSSKETYTWRCEGFILRKDAETTFYSCDFWEIVERVGVAGLTSHRDTSVGDRGFVDCATDSW